MHLLSELRELLVYHGYAEIELKEHPTSCCERIKTMVFNYESILKDFLHHLNNNQEFKTVDIIFFPKDRNDLIFVEMSSFQNWRSRDENKDKSAIEFLAGELKASVPAKIIESASVLLGIVGYSQCGKEFDDMFYPFFFSGSHFKIKTIFLLDLNYQEMNDVIFAGLNQQKISLTKFLDENTTVLNCKGFEKEFAKA